MIQRKDVQPGMVVRSRDGVQVGRIIDVKEEGIVVERGVFFVHDYLIPFRETHAVSGEEVYLTQTREHLERLHQEGPEARKRWVATVDATGALSYEPADEDEERMESTHIDEVPTTAGLYASAPRGNLGLGPSDLTEARMDSASFQDPARYDVRPTGEDAREHLGPERRASGPGWDALSEDEEAPRQDAPDTNEKTRY